MSHNQVQTILKALCIFNEALGVPLFSARGIIYKAYCSMSLIFNLIGTILTLGNIWLWCKASDEISSKLVKSAKSAINFIMIGTSNLNYTNSRKRKINLMIYGLTSAESLLIKPGEKVKSRAFTEIFFIVGYSLSLVIYYFFGSQININLFHYIFTNYQELQILILLLTILKLLWILSSFFSKVMDDPFENVKAIETIFNLFATWNNLYGLLLLQTFLHIFFIIVDNGIDIASEFERIEPLFSLQIVACIQKITTHFILSVLLSFLGFSLRDKRNKLFNRILIKLAFSEHSKTQQNKLKLLLAKLKTWPGFISAADYFILDYNFFLSILAAVASYLVILLQF